jgi:hypothetical protein
MGKSGAFSPFEASPSVVYPAKKEQKEERKRPVSQVHVVSPNGDIITSGDDTRGNGQATGS